MQEEREADLSSFLNGRPTALDCNNLPLSQRKTNQLHATDPLPFSQREDPQLSCMHPS
jgi:hypothetical protein